MNTQNVPDLIVRGKRVVRGGGVAPAAIQVRAGKITAIAPLNAVGPRCPIYDAGESVVMPGIVDTHVHINEPGRAEWEGFQTATRAAAAGGVTTLIEMPLNSIPATTSVKGVREKLRAAEGKLCVDVGFWGGVIPGNSRELRGLWDAGVFGYKCFLAPSGVDEFPFVGESELRVALPELASMGAVLLVHAELPGPIEKAGAALSNANWTKYSTWLASRPRAAENEAIELMIRLAREYGARTHIVHLSSSDAIPMLRRARAEGVRVTVESCPHYLRFAAEEIADGATEFKCAPPVRESENREKLWSALGDGVIDLIATDHSPCPPEMKCKPAGDFSKSWGGVASLELSLPATWTEAREHGYSLGHLARWLCAEPARLAGLETRKGAIAVGYDADFVIWNPAKTFRVEGEKLHQRHKLTPYAGCELAGVVEATFLRGKKIFDRGEFSADTSGSVLLRGRN
ncbi:MAG: allantoinase AllB [Candidatus Acidiferrales bacterium]